MEKLSKPSEEQDKKELPIDGIVDFLASMEKLGYEFPFDGDKQRFTVEKDQIYLAASNGEDIFEKIKSELSEKYPKNVECSEEEGVFYVYLQGKNEK